MTTFMAEADSAPRTYADQGVVQVRGLINSDEITRIREVFTEQVERDNSFGHDDHVPTDDVLRRYPRFVHPHRHPEIEAGRIARDLMLDPRIFNIVESLVGPAFAAQSMFYFKPPTARGQAVHQDNLFLQAHPETCIAAWIAIDRCAADNGGLVVVPGSHRIKVLCLEPADETESFTSMQVPLPEGVELVQTEMEPGDVLFFHGSLVHGSRSNTSDRFRRSLIFHYIPQASQEVAKFYNPLITRTGEELNITESTDGGACGDGWEPGPH